MGISTKAILNGKIDIMTIAKDLITEYGTDRNSVKVTFTHEDDFFQIIFDHKKPTLFCEMSYADRIAWTKNNHRVMCVFYACKSDYEDVTTDDMTYVSLGASGDAVEIMEALLKKYGGYIIRSDDINDWEKFTITE